MTTIHLGKAGLETSRMGLGCMGLSAFYGHDTAGADAAGVVAEALDLGLNFLDTSDSYGPWTNEEVVGAAIAGRREQVVLSTKFGRQRRSDGSTIRLNGTPEYVREACEASLRRLQTDYIDLYIYHRVDPTVPIEDTVAAMARLVEQGKVRYIGLSEVGPETLNRADKVHPVSIVQSEYSILSREVEVEALPMMQALRVGLVAFSPLARGLLAGHISGPEDLHPSDWRRDNPRFQGGNLEHNLRLVARLGEVAQAEGLTLSQLSLAWLIHQGAVPIQGATDRAQLRENAAAAGAQLSQDALTAIQRIAPPGAAAGDKWQAEYAPSLTAR